MFALQQPVEQDTASHTHLPATQSCPAAHAPHAAPAAPHEAGDSAAYCSHVPVTPPLQHPFRQVFASQEQVPVVVSHTPLVQLPHAAPPAPHWAADSEAYGTHALPLQQPVGHEVASHTHCPVVLLHSWPVPQAPHAAPAAPHPAVVSDA